MGLNTTMPNDIPTTDTLRDIPADLLGGPIPAEIHLGPNTLIVMDEPPEVLDVIDVVSRLRVKDAGYHQETRESPRVHYRKCTRITSWILGKPKPPNADDPDQGALFNDYDDTALADAKGLLVANGYTVIDPEPAEEPGAESDDDGTDNVARPDFSHSEGE